MKTALILFLAISFAFSCFGQEIEFCSSLNTSSEVRFQNAKGVGVQYQQILSKKNKIGIGIHFNSRCSQFDFLPYIDADPNLIVALKIHSHSERFSFSANFQNLVLDNENVSISIGPEISYNLLWGLDRVVEKFGVSSDIRNYKEYIHLTKHPGVGFFSKVEIKNVFSPKLSLCLTFRPEYLIGKNTLFFGSEAPAFYRGLSFTEFQIGFKYRIKQQ